MPALTSQQIASLSGCFDCLSPGIKDTYMVTLLNQILASLPGASLTTISTGGLKTVAAAAAANPARKKFTIQNQKNEELFVKFGTGASLSDFHITLPAHNAGVKHSDPFMLDGYVGALSVAPASGAPSYTFAEFV